MATHGWFTAYLLLGSSLGRPERVVLAVNANRLKPGRFGRGPSNGSFLGALSRIRTLIFENPSMVAAAQAAAFNIRS